LGEDDCTGPPQDYRQLEDVSKNQMDQGSFDACESGTHPSVQFSKINYQKKRKRKSRLMIKHRVCIPPEVYKYDLTIEPSIVVPASSRKPPVFKVSLAELMGSDGQDGIPQVIQDCANCIRSSG
jgi:hypothetical protein